nr:RNA-directed DNA polymerase, eukaryota [Tanacetum cinerariifolium]
MSRVQAWTEVVDKVKSRLSNWKMKSLSIGAGSKSCWRNIVNEEKILSNQGIKVLDYMGIKLGNGESTAFWDDNWIGGKVLKYSFLCIYALETEKGVTVNSKMSDTRLEKSLRRSIRRGVEQVQFNELSNILQSVSLMPYSDRWVWSLEGSREFSVASIQKIIDDNRLSTLDTRTLGIKYVPIKLNIPAWKIKIEALPTRFNISRRGIDIDSILCLICECGVESARHVFFSCSLVRKIVRKICSWKIQEWLNDNRNKSKSVLDQFKEELQKLDADIDKGIGSNDIVNKRLEVLNSIQHLDKIKAMDMDLECAVSKEELKRAVWECGTEKSPGPDGFSFGFYRPISLIGSMYKIIAKILANRLVGVLRDIVNEVQSAFTMERQFLDGPFILNEVI